MNLKQCVRAIEAVEQFSDDPQTYNELENARKAIKRLRDLCRDKDDKRGVYSVTGVCNSLASSKSYIVEQAAVMALDLWPREIGHEQVKSKQRCLIHCIFPFHVIPIDPSWLTSTVIALAQQIYEARDFSAMPILADALQDSGCDNPQILEHCRGPGPHTRGCWVVDALLGKQ